MSRRIWIYNTLFNAVNATPEFAGVTLRTAVGKTVPFPHAYPFVGIDDIEDFTRDEGGKAVLGTMRGKTEAGVWFRYRADSSDTKGDGKLLAEESRLIDVLEQAIMRIGTPSKDFPVNGSGGGYRVQIDYVIPTGNVVIGLDVGGAMADVTFVQCEIGWTQI